MQKEKIRGRDYILSEGRRLIPEFNLDEQEMEDNYRQMYAVISNNLTCDVMEKRDQKGLLLVGRTGVGKSMAMKVFQRMLKNTNRRFKWVTSLEIKDLVLEGVPVSEIKEHYGGQFHADLYIDDLGIGAVDQNQFGNVMNIIEELVHGRYDLFIKHGILTHFSTNLLPSSDIQEKTILKLYGLRTYDRIMHMTQTILFKGANHRQNA